MKAHAWLRGRAAGAARSVRSVLVAGRGDASGPNEFTATGTEKDDDGTKHLGELAVPTLFLCGRHDETRLAETSWYHSLVPGAELVVFEESSHMPHLEEPERYTQVLRDFLHRTETRVARKRAQTAS